MGPMDCTETWVRNYHYSTTRSVITQKSAVLIYFAAEIWNHANVTSHSSFDDLYSFCPWVCNVPGALSTGTKRLGRKPDQSLPRSADVTNSWRYTLKSPVYIHGTDKDDFTFTMGLQHGANSASLFLGISYTFIFRLPDNPVRLSCFESAVISLHPEACSFADLLTYVSAATSHFQLCCFQTTPCTPSPKPSSRFAILLLSSMLYHVTITAATGRFTHSMPRPCRSPAMPCR
jgi:hypothetical protein